MLSDTLSKIFDWFGKDVSFSDADEEEVTASVRVSEQAMLYWALQYGEHIEVLEPDRLRERIKEAVVSISERYVK